MEINLKELFKSDDIASEKTRDALIKAIKNAHQEGFDYLKFKISLQKMMELGMDKSTAIQSAFTTASVMGVTKKKLLSSANMYKVVLDKEREKFAAALKNKIARDVDGKRVEAERLKAKIISHKEKIKKLLDEIELYEQKIESVDDVVSAAESKIHKTRDDFRITFDAIYSQIEEDIINFTNTIEG